MKYLKYMFIVNIFFAQYTYGQTVTWTEDISCIFYTHCTSCHNPNGIAPFSLLDYNTVYALRTLIEDAVVSGEMPPWPADPDYVSYAHERLLTTTEITNIQTWVANGAPEGDPNMLAPTPVYTSSEQISNPDWVATAPVYTSTATNSDDYQCFVVTNPHNTDKFITAFEVIPGNAAIVHHVLVFKDPSNTPINQDNNTPEPGYDCFGGTNSNNSKFISGWAPGQQASYFPPGMGIKLEAGTNIILQLHYPEGSEGMVDNATKVNMILSDDLSLREVSNEYLLNHFTSLTNGPLFIPANTTKTFYSEFTVPINASLLSVFPHMHLIGRSIKSYGITPNGQTIPVIDIPEWDFEWQGEYVFPQPVFIPAGTVVYGEAFYDNTTANPHNPSNPPVNVSAGEATTDEMMLIFFSFLPYASGDENIIINNASHAIEYCDTVSYVCPPVITTSASLLTNGVYQAAAQVNSTGNIPANSNISFKAGTWVCMDNGFEIEATANFEAIIENCNNQ